MIIHILKYNHNRSITQVSRLIFLCWKWAVVFPTNKWFNRKTSNQSSGDQQLKSQQSHSNPLLEYNRAFVHALLVDEGAHMSCHSQPHQVIMGICELMHVEATVETWVVGGNWKVNNGFHCVWQLYESWINHIFFYPYWLIDCQFPPTSQLSPIIRPWVMVAWCCTMLHNTLESAIKLCINQILNYVKFWQYDMIYDVFSPRWWLWLWISDVSENIIECHEVWAVTIQYKY